ncbi:MAG TPA: hypothetical protein VND94_12095 [Terriglobia bacterium]|nr:hypothetical protein [Terriglobia bacterium]
MAKKPEDAAPSPRFTTKRIQVTIDQRPYTVVNMNAFDILIAGAPDWIAPKQKLDFTFLIAVGGREVGLPTYGVVLKNDASGLEVRYQAPNNRWRDLLAHVLTEENAKG